MMETARHHHFPMQLTQEISARPVNRATIGAVWQRYADVVERPFEELGNYVMPEERNGRSQNLRESYAHIHQETIVFYDGDEPVGWSSGAMLEPSTYFMAYNAVLPACQRPGIYSCFDAGFLPIFTTSVTSG